jgi:hypothetical protein
MGDLLHLIGMARIEHVSDDGFSGPRTMLQVTYMRVEDESSESREG